MSKVLSIIIPRYDETEKDIFPLLASINGQVGVDFDDIEVIISNDGGGAGALDEDFLSLFNVEIRQIALKENRGPGVARQVGLDEAKGTYVMFCDADDTLHSVGVIGALMQEAEASAPDMLSSEWLEELPNPSGGYQYITHHVEQTWMHGKLLRRAFLKQHNIRFHDELRVHEDSYILSIAGAFAERRRHLPITTYVWKFRPDSITRRNDGIYTFESFPTFIDACCMSHVECESRAPQMMEYKILQFVAYVYFSLQRDEWQTHEEYIKASEDMFAEKMRPFWKYWENASAATKTRVYNEERSKNFSAGMEKDTIEQWIQRMKVRGDEIHDEKSGDSEVA